MRTCLFCYDIFQDTGVCLFDKYASTYMYIFTFCCLQLQQYQYYSAGLLSNYDKFLDHQRTIVGPKKAKKTSSSSKIKGETLLFLRVVVNKYFELSLVRICRGNRGGRVIGLQFLILQHANELVCGCIWICTKIGFSIPTFK